VADLGYNKGYNIVPQTTFPAPFSLPIGTKKAAALFWQPLDFQSC
jgi:hypothetical protein